MQFKTYLASQGKEPVSEPYPAKDFHPIGQVWHSLCKTCCRAWGTGFLPHQQASDGYHDPPATTITLAWGEGNWQLRKRPEMVVWGRYCGCRGVCDLNPLRRSFREQVFLKCKRKIITSPRTTFGDEMHYYKEVQKKNGKGDVNNGDINDIFLGNGISYVQTRHLVWPEFGYQWFCLQSYWLNQESNEMLTSRIGVCVFKEVDEFWQKIYI